MKVAINLYCSNPATALTNDDLRRVRALRLSRRRTQACESAPAAKEQGAFDPKQTSLADAIRFAQQGNAAAFEFLYRLHCRRVYALCLRMIKNPHDAEDLTQEVFLRVFCKIHTFRGESAFSSWLHRLTVNVVLMRLRRKKLVSTSLDQNSVDDDGEEKPGTEIGAADPRLNGLFDRANLRLAVNRLPQGYKRLLILHDVHGYEHKEIAQILGCSVGTCKSQLHRARKGIREFLRGLQNYGSETDRGRTNRTFAPAANSL